MKRLQTNFGFFGNPTADRKIDNNNLIITITKEEQQREYKLALDLIRLELATLKHEIRGE